MPTGSKPPSCTRIFYGCKISSLAALIPRLHLNHTNTWPARIYESVSRGGVLRPDSHSYTTYEDCAAAGCRNEKKSRLNSMHRQLRAPRAHLPTLVVSNPNLARIHFTCTIQQFATVGQVSCCTLRMRGRLPCDDDDGVDPVITHAHPTGQYSRTNEPLLLTPTRQPQGALCSEI